MGTRASLVTVCIACALPACTFRTSGAAADDVGPHDALPSRNDGTLPPDATSDGGARDCVPLWEAGTVRLNPPERLDALDTSHMERDLWLSPDELTIFFSTDRLGNSQGDVFTATRTTPGGTFGAPAVVPELTSTKDDTKTTVSGDGLLAIVSTDRPGSMGGSKDLWVATRVATTDPFGAMSETLMSKVNDGNSQYDPWLSRDELRLYLAPASTGQQLVSTSRPDAFGPFGTPVVLSGFDSLNNESDVALSQDELVVLFSERLAGGRTQLQFAVRQSPSTPFATPVPIPDIDDGNPAADAHLSDDGCRLYFAHFGTADDWDLFVATVQ